MPMSLRGSVISFRDMANVQKETIVHGLMMVNPAGNLAKVEKEKLEGTPSAAAPKEKAAKVTKKKAKDHQKEESHLRVKPTNRLAESSRRESAPKEKSAHGGILRFATTSRRDLAMLARIPQNCLGFPTRHQTRRQPILSPQIDRMLCRIARRAVQGRSAELRYRNRCSCAVRSVCSQ